MTFNVGHIAGGTNSRCRITKPAHNKWVCHGCLAPRVRNGSGPDFAHPVNPGYRNQCGNCGGPRP